MFKFALILMGLELQQIVVLILIKISKLTLGDTVYIFPLVLTVQALQSKIYLEECGFLAVCLSPQIWPRVKTASKGVTLCLIRPEETRFHEFTHERDGRTQV